MGGDAMDHEAPPTPDPSPPFAARMGGGERTVPLHATNRTPSLFDRRRPHSPRSARRELPAQLARWLDALDETGRWALLKLVTGALAHRRLGAARQDRGRRARRQGPAGDRADLARPQAALHRAVRLARRPRREAVEPRSRRRSARRCWRTRSRSDFAALDPADFAAEWKWDGIRVQAVGRRARRRRHRGAALFAHRRGHFRQLPRSGRRAAAARPRSTASC